MTADGRPLKVNVATRRKSGRNTRHTPGHTSRRNHRLPHTSPHATSHGTSATLAAPFPPAGDRDAEVRDRTRHSRNRGLEAPELQAISQKSCNVLQELGPDVQWVQSYVTGDKIYCVYNAATKNSSGTRATRRLSGQQRRAGHVGRSIRPPPKPDAECGTAGPWKMPLALAIHLLGAPRVERDGGVAPAPRGHKVWGLLAYLVRSDAPRAASIWRACCSKTPRTRWRRCAGT